MALYNGPLSNSNDLCKGMYIDNNYNVYITGQSISFNPPLQETTTIKYSQVLGIVNQNNELPGEYRLYQNYPNPFNPVTTIKYALPKDVKVVVKIYDILGREVKTLVNQLQTAGYYDIKFDMSSYASGVYFYRIEAGDFTMAKKMVLVK